MPDEFPRPEPGILQTAGAKSDRGPDRSWWRDVVLKKLGLWQALFLMMTPTLVGLLVFSYYPKFDVIVKSLFRWEPGTTLEYVGIKNFLDAFADPLFWQSFELVGILLVANLLKLWPGIIAAIALHRLSSDKWRYWYQVGFVIPMVIPGIVWLLIWKSFYDPDFGLFNRFLNFTGLMELGAFLDGTRGDPGVMPRIADALQIPTQAAIDPVFGSLGGLICVGAMLLAAVGWYDIRSEKPDPQRFQGYGLLVATAALVPLAHLLLGLMGPPALLIVLVASIALLVALARALGRSWIIWPFIFIAGAVGFQNNPVLLPIYVAGVIGVTELLRRRWDTLAARDYTRYAGLIVVGLGAFLVLLGQIWTAPTEQFAEGTPAWLGSRDLVIPALLFWGFPWVGAVNVLIYLSGLQQISTDVYEAAELDGVGPVGMLFRIELPLIMTQIRISLIFLTIGTLTGYEMFLLLLGPDGGPANRGMVPGLYMFKKAFEEARFGYACALGMVLFVIILLLTIVYNRYVKVEK